MIATGFAGGPTGTRVLEQLREESVLTDFTRIAGETRINLAVIDPTSGEQTEINERGPAVSPEEVDALRRAARLPRRGGEDLRARRHPAARRRRRPLRAAGRGPARARRRSSSSTPRASAMLAGLRAGASVVTPNEREAEELVGQEFADPDDLAAGPLRAGPPRRRGSGDHPARRLRRGRRRGRRAALPRGPHRAARAGLHGRLRRRLPRRLRRRPLRGPLGRRTASPTASPAAPSRPSTSAPAPSTAARSSACSARSQVHDLEVPAEV